MVEDAADDAALGDEGDHPHHASAAGTDERIDLVHPANELGPSAAKGGQRGGRGVTRRRSVFARPWHERLCLLSLAAGPQLAAHDVRVGTVVVDEVAARIGDVGQQTGDEVQGIDGVGLLVVAADTGLVCGGCRACHPPQAGEADGVAQAVAGQSLECAAVAGWNGRPTRKSPKDPDAPRRAFCDR